MNRSILIVICDFLLVSLLAFSTVDINKVSDNGAAREVKVDMATNQIDSRQDLGDVMRLALNEERKNHDQLLGELAKTRDAANRQESLLSEREKQIQTFQQDLRSREQQTRQLEQQFATAQTNIQTLNQQLQSSSAEGLISKEKLAALEAEARKQAEEAAALKQQLAQLKRTSQATLTEKQRLAGQLQLAEAEKRSATELAAQMREQVQVERAEKATLAEGVKALASKSGQLAQEIRENRPLAPNTIFNEFVTNRVQANFAGTHPGIFGIESNKRKDTGTILVTDGTNSYALGHVQDTPLTFWNPGMEWESLTGSLNRGGATTPIRSLSFHLIDPRVIYIPVTDAQARELGGKVYRTSADPFKFQDAVLVGAREAYYGECKFQIDVSTPRYLKMDRSSLKGLFGKFNPSRGDLVFSRTGELLGIMANSTYCMMIHSFEPTTTFQFGQDVRDQHTGQTLTALYSRILGLPLKLQ